MLFCVAILVCGTKMALQTQFALSFELTRAVPLAIQIAEKTYEAAMKLARELQVCES